MPSDPGWSTKPGIAVALSLLVMLGSSYARPAGAEDVSPTAAKAAQNVEPEVRPKGGRQSEGHIEKEGLSDAELERMLTPLSGEDADARQAAAKPFEGLGPDSVPAIGRKLAELRKTTNPAISNAIKAARDASPNKNGDSDLADSLLRTRVEGPGYRPAVETTVLARSLARIGTTPAVRQLVKIAADQNAAFRPEVARLLKDLGDKAIAGLIETRKEPSSDLRHWSASQLEGMGKRMPGDAVQTKDNQVLADVLHAFADVHDMDSLPVLLSFVNSDRIQVRSAARDALAQFGQDAVWKLREAYANVLGKPAPDSASAAEIRKELFFAYDRLRLQEVYGLLDEGLAKENEGDLAAAIAAFNKVLAREPMMERRAEMVPAYVAYAQRMEESDPGKALALLRKAARLWPESPRLPQIQAEIAYLEGKELLGRGVADEEPFKRALSLDPNHEKARAELNRLENDIEERQERLRAIAAAAAVVIVAVLGILLFGGRRSPRRALKT